MRGTLVLVTLLVSLSGLAVALADSSAKPRVEISMSVSKRSACPGDTLEYRLAYVNAGDAEARAVQIDSPVPRNTTYLVGSTVGHKAVVYFSHDAGVTYRGSDTPAVTAIRWVLTDPLAPRAGGVVRFRVRVQ